MACLRNNITAFKSVFVSWGGKKNYSDHCTVEGQSRRGWCFPLSCLPYKLAKRLARRVGHPKLLIIFSYYLSLKKINQ